MNKTTMIKAAEAKVNELLDEIEAMKNNFRLSPATVRTQTQAKKHEARNLLIIKTLLEDKDLEGDLMKWFDSATTLKAVRKALTTVTFHDGEDFFSVQEAYPNKSYADLKRLMAEQGFHLEGHTVRR